MRGHGANAVEDVLRTGRARQGLHGYVGVGKNLVNSVGHGGSQLAGALESDGARESYGEIGEVAVPGAADAHAIDLEDAIDARDCIVNLGAHSRRSGVEQSVDGAPGQPPTDGDDDSRYEQCGNRIGIAQPVDVIGASDQNQGQTEHDHAGGPDVGGKVQGVGFQRLAVVFGGNASEDARAPPVEPHGKQHHGKGRDRRFDIDAAKEQTQRRFVDDPGTGQQKQAGFDECGKILDLAVTVLVVGVGGLVGDSDGEKCEQRSDQIEPGVSRFRQNAEAAGGDSDHES